MTIGDGATSCVAVLSAGTASCSLTTTTVGSATLTATYSGDGNFNISSGTASHTINKGATTTTIAADPTNPSVFGQGYAVTASVAVTAPAAGTPSGTFTISDGTNSCTTVAIAGGSATCTIPGGTVPGAATLTATYSGDGNFTSSSGTAPHTISKGATTTSITADPTNPSVFGQGYAVTASVAVTAPAAGTLFGTFTISDGSNSCTTGAIAGGSATCTIPGGTAPGSTTLTATYSGDTTFLTSIGTAPHTINKGATTTAITSDTPDPSVIGQAYTVSVTVAPVAPATGVPSGVVSVGDGQGHTCSITLAAGSGSCVLNGTAVGSATLTATYAGNVSFMTSQTTAPHTVNKGGTTTTITSDTPDPSVFGQPYTVTVTDAAVAPAVGTPTGAVIIGDGTSTCTVAALAGGTGSCLMPSGAPPGAATVTASYAGDASFNASSGTAPHGVNQGATTTSITSSTPNPSVFGQPYTVAVTVAPSGSAAGTPGGSVVVNDGQGHSCTVTLAAGAGTCVLMGTAVGAATLAAVYGGDANFAGSTGTGSHSVNQGGTTTTITSSAPNPSVFGQPYTVVVAVAPAGAAAGTPTGTVLVGDGQGHSCTVTLAGGTGSCALNGTAVGAATLSANFSGDASFAASAGTATHSVNQGATTTTISSSTPNPSVFGQPYTIAVTVAPSGAAAGTPTGSVVINDGQGHSCTATLAGGAGSCALNGTAVGPTTLSATYGGDASFLTSSGIASHTVNPGMTTTTITSDTPDPSVVGQPYTVTVAVAPTGAAAGTPAGTVTISDGAGHTCTTGAISGGSASCVLNNTPVGLATLTATYNGDTAFSGSADTEPHSVQQIPTTASLSASVNPSLQGQTVTFTATVSPPTATGTVTFYDGATPIGTVPVSGGTASLAISSLTAGAHTITATYNGDTNHATTTSPPLPHAVTPNGTVVLAVASAEGDGTFSFSSSTPLLNASVTTSSGNGQTAAASLNPGTYSVTVALPDGFGLTGVKCSDADSIGSVSGKSAVIVLSAAEAVTCLFSSANSRKKTVEVISRFMGRRNDMLLSNGPDQNRQIDRLLELGGDNGGDAEAGQGGSPSNLGGPQNGPGRVGEATGSGIGSPIAGGGTGHATAAAGQAPGRSFDDRLSALRRDDASERSKGGSAPVSITGSTEGSDRFAFATSLSQMRRANAENETAKVRGALARIMHQT